MNKFQPLAAAKGTGSSLYTSNLGNGILNSNSSALSENNNLNTFQNVQASENQGMTDAFSKALEKSNVQKDSGQTKDDKDQALSDERCKELFGSRDLLDAIADIDAYRFRYKEGMEEVDPNATPDKVHTGIMAQDLAKHPETSAAVEEDPLSGFLKVDTKELTMTTFALVTEIAKRLKVLEDIVLKENK